jgi:hypothetical protein
MTIPVLGNRIVTAGEKQLVAQPASPRELAPIQVNRWVRNGKHPNAEYENAKQEHINQLAMFRTKEVWSVLAHMGGGQLGTNPENRYRFAFHTGPLTHALVARVVCAPPWFPNNTSNSNVKLHLYTAADESVLLSSTSFNYGPSPLTGSAFGWAHLRVFEQIIDVAPDTDYYGLWQYVDFGRMFGATVFELASMTENYNGYLAQNIAAHGPVLDVYREKQMTLLKSLWKRGGGKVMNWSTDPSNTSWLTGKQAPNFTYKYTTSATGTNILDLSSTAVSSSTPGWTFDMSGKKRLAQTGVPVVMKAFGQMASGGANGIIEIKDSTGAVVASINAAFTTTFSWQSVAFNLPATQAKYDIHFRTNGGVEFRLWAISIYEYEA